MIGQTITHYKILEKLGEGGMGVVYKAQDTKLDRTVALKFLPPTLLANEDDRRRFVHEAQASAALSHPNIATVFEIDESEAKTFIALEYIEGQSLAEKINSGPLKLDDAISIGVQMCEGLQAAHEKGIVHRDIKSQNIMVTAKGQVKILDFGLAKLRGASVLTKTGATIGTMGYMSPEQLRGEVVDLRTDLWAVGVVLYEMIAGRRPFQGDFDEAVAYQIISQQPEPLTALRTGVPMELERIVSKALTKERGGRYQSAPEVARELQRLQRGSSARPALNSSQPQPSVQQLEAEQRESRLTRILPAFLKRNPWVSVSFVLSAVSIVLGYLHFQSLPQPQTVARSYILPPEDRSFNSEFGGHLAISPNGQILAFVAKDSAGINQLWIRALNSLSALLLPGTSGAALPFWSPESKSIAFFAAGRLKRVDAGGGPVTIICEAEDGRGGSWNQAGTIIFTPTPGSPLYRVDATGGVSSAITKFDTLSPLSSSRWPFFLPDGKHFLYTAQINAAGDWAICASVLGDTSQKRILTLKSKAEFANGYMMYYRENNLIAHPFDPGTLEFTGNPIPIAENIVFHEGRGRSDFSFSQNGVLVYLSGATRSLGLSLVDRNGKLLSHLKTGTVSLSAMFSPDGKRIALDSYDEARNSDIWMYDIARDLNTRFTFDAGSDELPVFSPDGNKVIFSSDRKKSIDLFIKDVSGMSNEKFFYGSPLDNFATSWSPDGKSLLLSVRGIAQKPQWDLLLLPLLGEKKPIPLAQTEFNEWWGTFSPDGRWVAYQSDESGKVEIYVRALDPSGGKWQVSSSGGEGAHWLRKSNEIIYTTPAHKVMAATVKYSSSSFEVIRTRVLFDLNIKGVGTLYDATADGQTFLVQFTGMGEASSSVTMVMNWQEELKKK